MSLERLRVTLEAWSTGVREATCLPDPFGPDRLAWRAVLIVVGLIAVLSVGLGLRMSQERTIESLPEVFMVDGVRLTTTADSGYFLQAAVRYADTGVVERLENQLFPESLSGRKLGQPPPWAEVLTIRAGTLPPILLATISRTLDLPLERSAYGLLLVGTALTGLAAYALFALLGSPIVGIVGAAGALFAWPVYVRTSVGMVDTDLLNLFFFFAVLVVIHLASTASTRRTRLLLAAAAGLLNYGFFLWYGKAAFAAFFVIALILAQVIHRVGVKDIAGAAGLFLMASGAEQVLAIPGALLGFESFYIGALGQELLPPLVAIRETIAEARPLTLERLAFGYGSLTVYALAILGALLWALQDWRRTPYAGLFLVFLLLSLQSGNRFEFYSVALLWVGFCSVIVACFAQLLRRAHIRYALNPRPRLVVGAAMLAAAFVFAGLQAAVPRPGVIPPPDAPARDLAFLNATLRSVAGSDRPVILTDWSLGYVVGYHTRAATLTDGGMPAALKTARFALAMMQTDPVRVADNLRAAAYFDEFTLRRTYPSIPPAREAFGTDRELWVFLPSTIEAYGNAMAYVATFMPIAREMPSAERFESARRLRIDPRGALKVLTRDRPSRWGEFEKIADEAGGAVIYRLPAVTASPTEP